MIATVALFIAALHAGSTNPDSTTRTVVADKHLAAGSADSIVVEKRKHTLTLFAAGVPLRTYMVALGNPVGDKQRQGDRRTPEGLYHIDSRNPASHYHLALHISYPDAAHVSRARASGVAPGGDIMIHGLAPQFAAAGALHRTHDWTEGCIALTNDEIDEIWTAVRDGTPIQIKP